MYIVRYYKDNDFTGEINYSSLQQAFLKLDENDIYVRSDRYELILQETNEVVDEGIIE